MNRELILKGGGLVAERVFIRNGFFGKLAGMTIPLKKRPNWCWLLRTRAIHTFFTTARTDIFFLDINLKIIGIKKKIKPARTAYCPKESIYCAEMRTMPNFLKKGDSLEIRETRCRLP
ncbi:MAG: hypothetical protein ACLFQK_05075 [Fibrobacterota bacterium]